jgi:hypothetical protein
MRNLFVLFVFMLSGASTILCQEARNEDAKYVIFTSDKKAEETREGIYKYTSKEKSHTHKSLPIVFRFDSKARGIHGIADYYEYDLDELAKIRKVTDRDKLVIKEEPSEFLNSITLIDMDVLFPKMTKDEFIKTWNSLWDKTVYFIDRSEIKNHKVKLHPVKVVGINLY